MTIDCLRVTKLATTEVQAYQWMSHAAESGSVYAKTQLALMYASGVGTVMAPQKAQSLLKEATAKGDEAAEFLLQILQKIQMEKSNAIESR